MVIWNMPVLFPSPSFTSYRGVCISTVMYLPVLFWEEVKKVDVWMSYFSCVRLNIFVLFSGSYLEDWNRCFLLLMRVFFCCWGFYCFGVFNRYRMEKSCSLLIACLPPSDYVFWRIMLWHFQVFVGQKRKHCKRKSAAHFLFSTV